VIAIEPEHVDAHFQRGVASANLEELDAAVAAYSRALDLDPGHVRALYARASCHNRRAEYARANGARARPVRAQPGPAPQRQAPSR
jgi:tetratricopeptide (TPR) repeat protein